MASYYKKIEDCPVTMENSTVLYPYIDNPKSSWFKKYGGFCTGMIIECSEVYTICPCVCTYVGQDDDHKGRYVAVVQFNSSISFRYCNLKELDVDSGDILDKWVQIGVADKTCRFEYLSSEQDESNWCVRVGQKQYYTQNPEEYVDGEIELYSSGLANPNDPDMDMEGILTDEDIPETTIELYGDGY